MKIIVDPDKKKWKTLCRRPELKYADLTLKVKRILTRVKLQGDDALRYYTKKFDNINTLSLKVSEEEMAGCYSKVSGELKRAIQLAKSNIEKFHKIQLAQQKKIETCPGVVCWQKITPIEKIGLYVPGGSAPLFSSVLMLAVPARIAGCSDISLCTPVNSQGTIDPVILYTAQLCGITAIFKIGGAQAIAAMAYGTRTVPKADKIFGPGNQFVTKAKQLVQLDGIAIDMPAGPSEVLVIADSGCDPGFVAADLLSQAEHGPDSQVMLLSNNATVIDNVIAELKRQLSDLPRKNIAAAALKNSRALLFNSIDACLEFSNVYAPEHLILAVKDPLKHTSRVANAGSVFVGNFSCESAGDYASGTNHTLPTYGFARAYSGVSTESFTKKISFQQLTAEGIKNLGPAIEKMAEAEGLIGHKRAITIRLKKLKR